MTDEKLRPVLGLGAADIKVRERGRIVSVAAIIRVAVTTEGKRRIVGLHKQAERS